MPSLLYIAMYCLLSVFIAPILLLFHVATDERFYYVNMRIWDFFMKGIILGFGMFSLVVGGIVFAQLALGWISFNDGITPLFIALSAVIANSIAYFEFYHGNNGIFSDSNIKILTYLKWRDLYIIRDGIEYKLDDSEWMKCKHHLDNIVNNDMNADSNFLFPYLTVLKLFPMFRYKGKLTVPHYIQHHQYYSDLKQLAEEIDFDDIVEIIKKQHGPSIYFHS